MVKTAEIATRNYAWGAMRAFLEGHKDRNWLLGMIRSSGVRGARLVEVFQNLRGYGNGQRYQEAVLDCRLQGWLPYVADAPQAPSSPQ